MNDQPVFGVQTDFVCVILSYLEWKYPGAMINQAAMNIIFEAAKQIHQAVHACGLLQPPPPQHE